MNKAIKNQQNCLKKFLKKNQNIQKRCITWDIFMKMGLELSKMIKLAFSIIKELLAQLEPQQAKFFLKQDFVMKIKQELSKITKQHQITIKKVQF